MYPQSTCPRRGKVTLVTFVWLFSNVCFQMIPQIAFARGCIIALAAFIWLLNVWICIPITQVIVVQSVFHHIYEDWRLCRASLNGCLKLRQLYGSKLLLDSENKNESESCRRSVLSNCNLDNGDFWNKNSSTIAIVQLLGHPVHFLHYGCLQNQRRLWTWVYSDMWK